MARVLQVVQQGQLRGAEVFALDLSRALVQRGWCVTLASLWGVDAAYAVAAAQAGVRLRVLSPGPRRRGLDPRVLWRLGDVVRAGGWHVVQANGADTLKYLAVARRLVPHRWPLVYRAIGMGSFWRRGRARTLVYRWLLRQADLVVAVGQAVARDLVGASGVDERKVAVVPNGVDPTRILVPAGERHRVRTSLGIAPHECLVVTAGSLTPEKDPEGLVDVVAACRARGLPVRGLVVGEGPLRARLAAAVERRGLAGAVALVPPQHGLGAYLAAADLLVLPSRSEGMPAVVIEAGLVGVPAVAYAVGGVGEIIEDGVTGLLVPAGDRSRLAQAVARLAAASQWRVALGAAARQRYRRFDVARVARDYDELYQHLLDAWALRRPVEWVTGRLGEAGP